MKKFFFKLSHIHLFLFIALFISFSSCKKGVELNDDKNLKITDDIRGSVFFIDSSNFHFETIDSNSLLKKDAETASTKNPPAQLNKVLLSSATDGSGWVEVKIWSEAVYGSHPHAEVSVDPGYVLIGGGAAVNPGVSGVNAMLTSSYPKDDGNFSTWIADSKDHYYSYNHQLYVYAIGMKITDPFNSIVIDPTYLKSLMSITKTTSSSAHFPSTSSSPVSGNLLLSGGAKINQIGQGSLLVSTALKGGPSWLASGKDHYFPQVSTVESYNISINPNILGFGVLEGKSKSGAVAINSAGHHVGQVDLNDSFSNGFVISGASCETNFTGAGRLLVQCYPVSPHTVGVYTKDHIEVSNGTTIAGAIGIRKKP